MDSSALKEKYGVTEDEIDIIHRHLINDGSINNVKKILSDKFSIEQIYAISTFICRSFYDDVIKNINENFYFERKKIQVFDVDKILHEKQDRKKSKIISELNFELSIKLMEKKIRS